MSAMRDSDGERYHERTKQGIRNGLEIRFGEERTEKKRGRKRSRVRDGNTHRQQTRYKEIYIGTPYTQRER